MQGADRVPSAFSHGTPCVINPHKNVPIDIGCITKIGVGMLPASISGSSWRSMRNFSMVIHQLRVYSRVLSAEEVAHNYEIDKVRFAMD